MDFCCFGQKFKFEHRFFHAPILSLFSAKHQLYPMKWWNGKSQTRQAFRQKLLQGWSTSVKKQKQITLWSMGTP